MSKQLQALIFDCDGVLVDTERDGHRVAFNQAFAKKGLDAGWDVPLYGQLLEVAGGKERMRHYFMTYKLVPGQRAKARITKIYGRDHARKVVKAAMDDYASSFTV